MREMFPSSNDVRRGGAAPVANGANFAEGSVSADGLPVGNLATKGAAEDQHTNKIGLANEHDKSIPLYCQHSPSNHSWRGKLRRWLFPRTHSEMEVFQGRSPLNKQKTIMVDWLDYLVILLVTFTCVLLCLQDPLDRGSDLMSAIQVCNNVLGFLFSIENVLRILCFGFIYFTADYWNIFDSLIVASSLVTTIIDLIGSNRQAGYEALRIFILFRVLRSVRFIDTARITMIASVRAFKSIGDVGILLVLFLVLAATGGVTQYNSKLTNRCLNVNTSAFLAQREAWIAQGQLIANDSSGAGGYIPSPNSTLTQWELLMSQFNDMGNFTRYQSYDQLQLQRLRKLVEYRQCGYRYADYRSSQNITVCSYRKTCTATTTVANISVHQKASFTFSNASGTFNATDRPVSLTNVTPVNASSSTTGNTFNNFVETYSDYQNCIFIDGSVVCSAPYCKLTAQYLNRTLVMIATFADYDLPFDSSNLASLAATSNEPSYLLPNEFDDLCGGLAESIPGTKKVRVWICVSVDSDVKGGLAAILIAAGEPQLANLILSSLSTSPSNAAAPIIDQNADVLNTLIPKSDSYYCLAEDAPTIGQILYPQVGGRLAEVSFPFSSPWMMSSGWNKFNTSSLVTFPGMVQWCVDELMNRVDKRFALLEPYHLPNISGMNITTNCAAVNQTILGANAALSSNLCCGRNEEGRVVCCASTNRTDTGATDYPADVMSAVCCSVNSAEEEVSTYLAARPLGAYNASAYGGGDSVQLPIVAMSLADLVNSSVFNHSVCEASLPSQLFSSFFYSVNRSSSDPEIYYYSQQQQTWQLRVNLNLTNELTLGMCVPEQLDSILTLTPPQSRALTASRKQRIFHVQWSDGSGVDPTTLVPTAFSSFVTPPSNFHPSTQNFNGSSDNNQNLIPGVNQTAPLCTLAAECYSRPLLLDAGGYDDPYDIVTYYCGERFDEQGSPLSPDVPFGSLGLHWTDAEFQQLPPYDEVFRGLERQAMGQSDFEANAWRERNCDSAANIYLEGYKCPFDYSCTSYQNPFFGMLGFENLPSSMLTDFTCITRESWHDVMYRAIDAMDQTAAIIK
ncbi:calcium channel protein, putative, partial [Bodo saltans]